MTNRKLNEVATIQAQHRAQKWYDGTQSIPYKMPITNIYKKTSHRNYLSNWIEAFIVKFMRSMFPTYKTIKVENRGKAVLDRVVGGRANGQVVGIKAYRKDNNTQIVGEPDLRCMRPGMQPLYFEVKVGKDRLSKEQEEFIKAGFGDVVIIKTLDDFWEWFDKYQENV